MQVAPVQPERMVDGSLRLIDADAFKTLVTAVAIADGLSGGFLNEFCRLIDSQKTAYDVDGVVGQLRELNENEFTYARVMHIVKAGGVDG